MVSSGLSWQSRISELPVDTWMHLKISRNFSSLNVKRASSGYRAVFFSQVFFLDITLKGNIGFFFILPAFKPLKVIHWGRYQGTKENNDTSTALPILPTFKGRLNAWSPFLCQAVYSQNSKVKNWPSSASSSSTHAFKWNTLCQLVIPFCCFSSKTYMVLK